MTDRLNQRTDKSLVWGLRVSLLTAVAVVVLGPVLVILSVQNRASSNDASNSARSASDTSAASKMANDLQACRAKFNIPVQEANGKVSEADQEISKVSTSLFLLVIRAYRANLEGDTAQFVALLEESKAIELQLATGSSLRFSAGQLRTAALEEYEKAVQDSIDRPIQFLVRCGIKQVGEETPPGGE